MSAGKRVSTSTRPKAGSLPWTRLARLGERILAEWEPSSGLADNQTRWLAHYLAEILENAKNETDPARRSRLRHECADLILNIWKHREHWPRGQPFKALSSLVEELSEKTTPFSALGNPQTWGGLIKELDVLHQREKRWLMQAAAAHTSERTTTEWEQVATQFFSSDENLLAKLRKQLLDDSSAISIKAEDTSAQKHRRLLSALRDLEKERANLHVLIKEEWFEAASAGPSKAKTKKRHRAKRG